jgi:hypothetical protein
VSTAPSYIGTLLSDVVSGPRQVGISGGAWTPVASLTLTPGQWLLFGALQVQGDGTQVQGVQYAATSVVGAPESANSVQLTSPSTNGLTVGLPVTDVSVIENQTFYLVANPTIVGTQPAQSPFDPPLPPAFATAQFYAIRVA